MSNTTTSDTLPPDRSEFLIESLDLFGSTTVSGVLYGIVLMLYYLCLGPLLRRLRNPHYRRQATLFSLVHATLVVSWATVFLALSTRSMQLVYIEHGTYPGGPYEYEVSVLSHQPISPLSSTSSFMLGILTLGIQIWRLWVIWSATRYTVAIIIAPILLFISFMVLSTISILGWSILPNIFPRQSDLSAVSTTVYGVGAATTILVTTLAIARLMLVRNCHIKVMGISEIASQYMNIAAILTESYALESVWSLIAMILNAIESPVSVLFIQCENFIRVIAYFLVVHRISTGRAWKAGTERELSTLRWNHTTPSSASDTVV